MTHSDMQNFDWNEVYSGQQSDFMPPDPLLLELASGVAPGHVLDVGCGAGGLLAALAPLGFVLHGIDVAPRAIEAARKVLAGRGITAELAVADAATWTPPRTYDLVTNCFALPMTRAEQQKVYATLRAAVAPGGTVILKDFDTQMHRVSPFESIDLVSVADLHEAFAGFDIERAEVVDTPAHDHEHGRYGEQAWTAALLVARRPR